MKKLIMFRGCIMNKKGFISTASLFSFFLVFCTLLILIMTTYTNNRVNFKMIKNDLKKYLITDSNTFLKSRYKTLPEEIIEGEGPDGPQSPDTPSNPDVPTDPDNPPSPDPVIPSYKAYEKVLLDNSAGASTVSNAISFINGRGTPNFNSTATTNEGMFFAEDNLGSSYYFRGAVNNNWVKFGKYTKDMYNCTNGTISETDTGSCTKIASSGDDIYWRIIRINGDNSIRMIYSGTNAPTATTSVIMTGSATAVGQSVYNTVASGAEYTGYMYQKNYQRNNVNNSAIKNKVDEWFAGTSLASTNSAKVKDTIFCNDRGTVTTWASIPSSNLIFNGRDRNVNQKNPSLKCNAGADKFTVSNDNSNKALRYPVGLITIDEVAMAGGYSTKTNKNYYLYAGIYYYTMTPNFIRRGGAAFVFFVDSEGKYPNFSLTSNFYIRPVINLNGDVKFKGSGTYDDIYEVVE